MIQRLSVDEDEIVRSQLRGEASARDVIAVRATSNPTKELFYEPSQHALR